MREVFEAVALSFGVVFLAELGDKSQLLAVLFATKMRPWLVLVGIAVASGLVHLVSVGAGHYLSASFDPRLATVLGGAALLGCGVWGLRGHASGGAQEVRVPSKALPGVATVVSAFVLAELGDKTMFATVALGAGRPFFGVWLGSTAGMVAADALAVLLGLGLARRIPEAKLAFWANVVFLLLGASFLLSGLWQLAPGSALLAAAVLGGALLVALGRSGLRRRSSRLRQMPERPLIGSGG